MPRVPTDRPTVVHRGVYRVPRGGEAMRMAASDVVKREDEDRDGMRWMRWRMGGGIVEEDNDVKRPAADEDDYGMGMYCHWLLLRRKSLYESRIDAAAGFLYLRYSHPILFLPFLWTLNDDDEIDAADVAECAAADVAPETTAHISYQTCKYRVGEGESWDDDYPSVYAAHPLLSQLPPLLALGIHEYLLMVQPL